MTKTNDLIQQLESSLAFLTDLWLKTKDLKLSEQIKVELFEAQEQLTRIKSGYDYND